MTDKPVLKVVASHFYPEQNALIFRFESFLPLLAEKHHVVVVYLLQPGLSFDQQATEACFAGLDIAFEPVEAAPYDKGNFLKRSIGEARNCVRLWRRARRVRADVLLQSVPQLMLLPVSLCFVPFDRTSRKILEIRDLTWQYIDYGAGFAGRALARFFDWVAATAIGRFDEVITCTEAQADYVRTHTKCPVTVVRNGIAQAKFRELSRTRYDESAPRTLVAYFGTFGYAQNLITLLHAARETISEDDIGYLLVGSGTDTDMLTQFRDENGLTNVQIVGRVEWETLLDYHDGATVLYAQLRNVDALMSAEPSKLFEYFATGKPSIYGGKGLGAELARQFENAYLVEPDDPLALARAIRTIHAARHERSAANIERIRKDFVRERIFRNYLEGAGLL